MNSLLCLTFLKLDLKQKQYLKFMKKEYVAFSETHLECGEINMVQCVK